jgi:cytochrome c oxidase subunit 2
LLETGGIQAAKIASLFWLFTICSTVVWALVAVAAARAVWKRRTSDEETLHRRLERTVGVAAGLTALVLFGLLIGSIGTGHALASDLGTARRHVKVIGHKWWWEFQYDPAASTRVVLANELHLPVGEPVMLELESEDVIHSFWVPALHGKRDLVPGRPTTFVLRADVPGEYQGRCAEFCGLQHANMGFTVVAEPRESFIAWLEHERSPGSTPDTPGRGRGQRVFLSTRCALCHTVAGTGARGAVGPDLTHVASRHRLGAGVIPNTPGHLAGWVVDSQALKPGNAMPPNPLPPEDLEPLLDYLGTLR